MNSFSSYEEWEVIVGHAKQAQVLSRLEEDGQVNNKLSLITNLTRYLEDHQKNVYCQCFGQN